MNIRILITLLFGVTLFCSCQPKQLPVNSLAERVTEGTSKDRILFRMTPEKDDVSKDYFEITAEDGKVLIVGNSDLSLATGLNWYLKYVAGIHLSWNNPSQKLPEVLGIRSSFEVLLVADTNCQDWVRPTLPDCSSATRP